jgi:hypothetical protein
LLDYRPKNIVLYDSNMREELRKKLNWHRSRLVEELGVTTTFLASLLSKEVISNEDNSICEQHLSIGPLNVRCRRIDKTDRLNSNGKNLPSRLLVYLGYESLAIEILDHARQLRFSTDDDVRLKVYFSRDMTPEESKLAFEECVRSRKRENEASNANQTVLSDVRRHPSGPSMVQSFAHASNVPGPTSLQIVPTSYKLTIGDTSQFPPLVHPIPESDVCQSSHASTSSSVDIVRAARQ